MPARPRPEPARPAPLRIPATAVVRPRLHARLDAVPPGGVALLTAPAGSGKSVLMGQWMQTVDGASCRLAVSPAHDDPVVLARDLNAVLETTVPGLPPEAAGVRSAAGAGLGRYLSDLLAALDAAAQPVTLLLDDVHGLSNGTVWDDLDRLVSDLPDVVRIVLAARWDPPLRLQRLRLQGRIVELRARDLAFDVDESGALLEAVSGQALERRQVEALVARTEGWAAALQLAGISLQRTTDVDAFIADFAGSNQLVADYLTEEVLDDLEPEVRRFLLHTSVLPWLTPALCDAVTGTGDAEDMLDLLNRRSLFVTEPDVRGRPVQYHQLFADLLRYSLHHAEPGLEAELRGRAVAWLLDHDDVAEAVDQLLARRDAAAVLQVVEERGQAFFEREEAATIVRWLSAARALDAAPPPALEVNLLAAQMSAHQMGPAAETYRRLRRRSDIEPGDLAAASALYACIGLDDLPTAEVRRAATEAIDVLEQHEGEIGGDFLGVGGRETVQFLSEAMLAIALLHDGAVSESRRRFEKLRELPGAQYRIWKPYTLGALAFACALSGRCAEADALATSAINDAEANGVRYHHGLAYAYLARAMVGLDRVEPHVVAEALRESDVRVTRTGRAAFVAIQSYLQVEQTAATDGAEHALDQLRSAPRAAPVPPLVASLMRAQELRLLVDQGRLTAAESLVDAAADLAGSEAEIIDLRLESGDVTGARAVLDAWEPLDDVRAAVQRHLRTMAVLTAEGAGEEGAASLQDALHLAEAGGLRRPFLVQPLALRQLRNQSRRGSQSFARSIVDAAATFESRVSGHDKLIEPLTDREREVLDFLPTRLSNTEIAAALFVSVNTLKSHLRHIYAKLAVADRDAAVAQASELGLL